MFLMANGQQILVKGFCTRQSDASSGRTSCSLLLKRKQAGERVLIKTHKTYEKINS